MDETNQVSEEKMKEIDDLLQFAASYLTVSYTHLTLPTNSRV